MDSFIFLSSRIFLIILISGVCFLAVGYFLTNPRLRRARQQLEHYKNECSRMARTLAGINREQKELLENIQSKEQEKLLLQTTLETKDDELVGLLDRLNNLAIGIQGSSHGDSPDSHEDSRDEEIHSLRERITSLSSRLHSTETALSERKAELADAIAKLETPAEPSAPLKSTPKQEVPSSEAAASQAGPDVSPSGPDWEKAAAGKTESESPTDTETIPEAPPAPKTSPESEAEQEPPAKEEDRDAPHPETSKKKSPPKTAFFDIEGAKELLENELAALRKELATAKQTIFSTEDEPAEQESAEEESEPGNLEKTPDPDAGPAPAEPGALVNAPAAAGQPSGADSSKNTSDESTSPPAFPVTAMSAHSPSPASTSTLLAEPKTKTKTRTEPKPETETKSKIDRVTSKPIEEPSSSSSPFGIPIGVDLSSSPGAPVPPPIPATTTPASVSHDVKEHVIFRGSDPSLWGKASHDSSSSPPASTLLDLSKVSEDTRYVRIRRMDTRESVIVPTTKDQLLEVAPPQSIVGWNGANQQFDGAFHLGAFDHSLPQEVETRIGAGGWGFGHHYGKADKQAYAWGGVAIAKTEFEISTLSELPEGEKAGVPEPTELSGPAIPASSSIDLVFFRSSNPNIWNKNVVDGKGGFALHISRVPNLTQYVKVRRMDTLEAVILALSKDRLLREVDETEELAWNGSAEFFFGGHHLGICDPCCPEREIEIHFGCGGWGFGHVVDANDRQAYGWAGKSIGPTQFEFTAIARDLHPDEVDQLLNL